MSATPEGRVKNELKRYLDSKGESLHALWPVQNGMGTPALDVHVCFKGKYIGIECKAPGKNMTPRQVVTATKMHKAGAIVLLFDGSDESWRNLMSTLEHIEDQYNRLALKQVLDNKIAPTNLNQ